MARTSGTFEVRLTPQTSDGGSDPIVGRLSIDKQFRGELEATSKGEMLAGGDPKKGSGGYVAIERVSGALNGHTGTFLLQHNGTMQSGNYKMDIIVVPGSGSDQLAGLDGKMEIIIKDGKHSYDFAYTLPAAT